MRNLKMTIEYDGKRYQGWQRLADSDKTIQGKIENIIKQMTGETIEIVGSGRTDAGTHAYNQVANFKTESNLSIEEMLAFFQQYLPQDIVVKKIEEMDDRFHSRYHAKGKIYKYRVWNATITSAFDRPYSFYYPNSLDASKMQEACEKLTGTHDFIGFSALKKSKKSTVRTIHDITFETKGDVIEFTFTGDGFLHKMIRVMMGTILEIGAGDLDVSIIDDIFKHKKRSEAGITVPAQGLFLEEVLY